MFRNVETHTSAALVRKHVAQTPVTAPTSRSFFRLPLDSIGNLRSIANNRPPYRTNPAAATKEATAKSNAETFFKTAASEGTSDAQSHRPI